MNPILKSDLFYKIGKFTKKVFGRKNGKKIPVYCAMLVLWLCMGLWHGSSWKYIIGEGFWFWLVIVIGQIMNPYFKKIKNVLKINENRLWWKIVQVIRTFLLFCFGMIFFEAKNLMNAIEMIRLGFISASISEGWRVLKNIIQSYCSEKGCLFVIIIIILIQILADMLTYHKYDLDMIIRKQKLVIRWLCYWGLLFIIMWYGGSGEMEFVYFQF